MDAHADLPADEENSTANGASELPDVTDPFLELNQLYKDTRGVIFPDDLPCTAVTGSVGRICSLLRASPFEIQGGHGYKL